MIFPLSYGRGDGGEVRGKVIFSLPDRGGVTGVIPLYLLPSPMGEGMGVRSIHASRIF